MNILKQLKNKLIYFCLCLSFILNMIPIKAYATTKTAPGFMDAFTKFMNEYSTIIGIVMSIGLLISIVIFIIHVVNLNKYADNPQMRKTVMQNLMVTMFCLAAQGIVTVILAIMYFVFT